MFILRDILTPLQQDFSDTAQGVNAGAIASLFAAPLYS